jgi:hypothetical protein
MLAGRREPIPSDCVGIPVQLVVDADYQLPQPWCDRKPWGFQTDICLQAYDQALDVFKRVVVGYAHTVGERPRSLAPRRWRLICEQSVVAASSAAR